MRSPVASWKKIVKTGWLARLPRLAGTWRGGAWEPAKAANPRMP
jgi:hypothetical protein